MKPNISTEKRLTQIKSASKAYRELVRNFSTPADRWLAKYYNDNRRTIGSRDRRFISATVFTALRHKLFFEYWLQRSAQGDLRDPVKNAKFIIAMAAVKEGMLNCEDFSECWSSVRDHSHLERLDMLFDVLKNHKIEEQTGEFQEQGRISILYSMPLWMVRKWMDRFGEEKTESLAKNFLVKPGFVLRANTLKISREELISKFNSENFEMKDAPNTSFGIEAAEHYSLNGHSFFNEGLFEVQSKSSQIATEKINPLPGEEVWDVCAGGGGKTIFMASLMKNQGKLPQRIFGHIS